uniref:crotonase/enoyl-CoA hydratase family protein n=1 Tax=Gordonia sp. B7-2 TaxID=3420932 RepID=UPI003D93AE5B
MAASSGRPPVVVRTDGEVSIVGINRPEVRNAVDRRTAHDLADAFRAFDADPGQSVAVLYGEGGTFCAGADLKAIAAGDPNRVDPEGDAPMGVSRMRLSKPVIAAISGHAVAGGLELACWADLRVADDDAVLGVFCRRWGVPLIDGGTVRLPRLIGHSRAMDLVLTGRAVSADEALSFGLVNRVVPHGKSLDRAVELARELAALPQACLRHDRMSMLEQGGFDTADAMRNEFAHGLESLAAGAVSGAERFTRGAGRHGAAARPDLGP